MALRKDSLAVTFAGGLNTKTDAKQVTIPKLLDLQNCVFTKDLTLSKRFGYGALGKQVDGSVATYSDARGLGARGNELVLFAGEQSYSHRESTDTWSLDRKSVV